MSRFEGIFVNLWPFAAVMIALLMLFLFNISPHPYRQVPADLPRSASATTQPGAQRDDAMHVTVTRDGAVYFGHNAMRLRDLAPAVQSAIRDGRKKVYISVDARAKNGDVKAIIDELRRAGIIQI